MNTTLYHRITQFYLRQWRLVDTGDFDACGRTFAEDAVLVRVASPERMRARGAQAERVGRGPIVEALARVAGRRADAHEVRRHWMGQLIVHPTPDGDVRTRFSTLVIDTAAGGGPVLRNSAVVEDLLARAGDTWQVRHRRIHHDEVA